MGKLIDINPHIANRQALQAREALNITGFDLTSRIACNEAKNKLNGFIKPIYTERDMGCAKADAWEAGYNAAHHQTLEWFDLLEKCDNNEEMKRLFSEIRMNWLKVVASEMKING